MGKPAKRTKNSLLQCYKKWGNGKNIQGIHENGRIYSSPENSKKKKKYHRTEQKKKSKPN